MVGTEDKVAPEAAHAVVLHSAHPDAPYLRLDGIGHMPKLEAPAAFTRLIDVSHLRDRQLSAPLEAASVARAPMNDKSDDPCCQFPVEERVLAPDSPSGVSRARPDGVEAT